MISNCLSFLVCWCTYQKEHFLEFERQSGWLPSWQSRPITTSMNLTQVFPSNMKKNGAGYYIWYWVLLTKIYQKYSSYYKCLFTVNFAFSYFYFLQNAVNLTSTLVRKASTADSKVNILVSFEKLKVFAMNFASLHLTPQNGSEREISIEQEELGIALFVTVLQIIVAISVFFLVCLFVF